MFSVSMLAEIYAICRKLFLEHLNVYGKQNQHKPFFLQ